LVWQKDLAESAFSLWCSVYFPVLGSLKLGLLCRQTLAITSLSMPFDAIFS